VEPGKLQERREARLDEWPDGDLLHVSHFHVLLIGPPSITNVFLNAMRPALRQPVVECVAGTMPLPHQGTVILRNVESLDERRQTNLSARIASSAVRIVTVCQEPLYPKVIDRSFSSDLYYRLNALTLVTNPRTVAERPTDAAAVVPTLDAIARRAYELFEERGREDGRDRDDWLQAERECQQGAPLPRPETPMQIGRRHMRAAP
jgi:hypothetical protein